MRAGFWWLRLLGSALQGVNKGKLKVASQLESGIVAYDIFHGQLRQSVDYAAGVLRTM